MIPFRSYGQPPPDEKFIELDYFELRVNNYIVPSNDTTYHCKIYKYKILIDDENSDLVHHLLLHGCNSSFIFNDNNLPDEVCDDIVDQSELCATNIATGWAIGGDHILEFPEKAGYPVGVSSPNRYFMIQTHYDNSKQTSNRRDNSGIRFYLDNKLRQHDLGYLRLGTVSTLFGLIIPPKVENFIVDSYCPSVSLWAKLIRNKTAVEYLFNAESYNFNYQFENRLTKRIQLYPGGQGTRDEMCLHFFSYYPRIDDLSICFTMNTAQSLQTLINSKSQFDFYTARKWLHDLIWTIESCKQ
ncbi:unnamed protein product [Rotaria sp. Silwood1]|nr:unnamed protein product [Rotaria sp. Silwood1]